MGFPPQEIPEWVPDAIAALVTRIDPFCEKDPSSAAGILDRLVSMPDMKRVWSEVYKHKREGYRPTDKYMYPADVRSAFRLAKQAISAGRLHPEQLEPNWREREAARLLCYPTFTMNEKLAQDIGAQYLFMEAFNIALAPDPVLLSVIQQRIEKFSEIENAITLLQNLLATVGMYREAQVLTPLWDIVSGEAEPFDKRLLSYDSSIIVRESGELALRGFVGKLSIVMEDTFNSPLYGTIGHVANTVFDRTDLTASKIREMVRS